MGEQRVVPPEYLSEGLVYFHLVPLPAFRVHPCPRLLFHLLVAPKIGENRVVVAYRRSEHQSLVDQTTNEVPDVVECGVLDDEVDGRLRRRGGFSKCFGERLRVDGTVEYVREEERLGKRD